MGIFRRDDPIAAIEGELASLQRREDRLKSRVAAAESELVDAKARRRAEIIEDAGDDGPVPVDDSIVPAIEAHLVGLRDALAEVAARREAAERDLDEIRDRARREQMAARLAEIHGQIVETLAAQRQSGAKLFDVLRQVNLGEMLARQLAQTDNMLAAQIAELLREMESRRVMLLSGATAAIAIEPPTLAPVKAEEAA